jgi:myo-inositol-1(or 4)-monophosphatase
LPKAWEDAPVNETLNLSRRLAEVATVAAQAVAPQLRAAFRQTMTVDYKLDNHDIVTVHDRQAEDTIREVLHRHVPDSVIVGEEKGSDGTGEVCWYVDPIDGTANFASGLAFFCTSIGAVVDGEIVAGVVLDPMANNVFVAHLGGAFVNETPLRSTGAAAERDALIITGYPTARDLDRDGSEAFSRMQELVTTYSSLRRPGSAALTLSHVAAGWVDAAFGTSVNAWDVTAAILILRQAGGTYRPLGAADGTPDWDAPGYVGHTGDLQADVLHRIGSWFDAVRQPIG